MTGTLTEEDKGMQIRVASRLRGCETIISGASEQDREWTMLYMGTRDMTPEEWMCAWINKGGCGGKIEQGRPV